MDGSDSPPPAILTVCSAIIHSLDHGSTATLDDHHPPTPLPSSVAHDALLQSLADGSGNVSESIARDYVLRRSEVCSTGKTTHAAMATTPSSSSSSLLARNTASNSAAARRGGGGHTAKPHMPPSVIDPPHITPLMFVLAEISRDFGYLGYQGVATALIKDPTPKMVALDAALGLLLDNGADLALHYCSERWCASSRRRRGEHFVGATDGNDDDDDDDDDAGSDDEDDEGLCVPVRTLMAAAESPVRPPASSNGFFIDSIVRSITAAGCGGGCANDDSGPHPRRPPSSSCPFNPFTDYLQCIRRYPYDRMQRLYPILAAEIYHCIPLLEEDGGGDDEYGSDDE